MQLLSFLFVVFPFYRTQTVPEGDFLFTECNTNKQEFEYYYLSLHCIEIQPLRIL